MTLRSRTLLVLALSALSAAAAPAAQAAWSAPQPVVADAGAGAVAVAAAGNRHGSEAFAWTVTTRRLVRVAGRTGLASYVRARTRLPDGRLGRLQTISSTGGLVSGAQIGVDERGNVTAVWTQAGRHLSVMAAVRPHGRRFGRPFELGRSQHFVDARPALAVSRFGDAVVAWNHGRSVQVVRRGVAPCRLRAARGCFTAPLALRAGADQTVAIGPLGSAYVVWAVQVRTAPGDVHTRLRMTVLRRSGRRLGTEHFLTAGGDAAQPSLAVLPDATALVAWRASLPAGGEQDDPAPIMAVATTPDANLAAPQAVSTTRGDRPQLRVSARGEALIAFTQIDPTPANPDGPEIAVAIRPAGSQAFGAPATISPPGVAADSPALAVDGASRAHLLYGADAGAAGRVAVTHVRAPGSIFGPPVTLPAAFAGGTLLAAGPRLTAISGPGARALVSDWTP